MILHVENRKTVLAFPTINHANVLSMSLTIVCFSEIELLADIIHSILTLTKSKPLPFSIFSR